MLTKSGPIVKVVPFETHEIVSLRQVFIIGKSLYVLYCGTTTGTRCFGRGAGVRRVRLERLPLNTISDAAGNSKIQIGILKSVIYFSSH